MRSLIFVLPLFVLTACIGDDLVDDYVAPVIRISNLADTIEAGTAFQFTHQYVNNIGQAEDVAAVWTSSNTELLTIDANGLASAIAEGDVDITASFTDPRFDETATVTETVAIGASTVVVVEPMMRSGSVATTSSYPLSGNFVLEELPDSDELKLSFGEEYIADELLPGLYVYLSNNPNSTVGAFEIGAVQTFRGAHEYTFNGAELEQFAYVLYFCKPFNVKVGHGDIEG